MTTEIKITLEIPGIQQIVDAILSLRDGDEDDTPAAAGEAPKARRGRKSNAEKAAAAATPVASAAAAVNAVGLGAAPAVGLGTAPAAAPAPAIGLDAGLGVATPAPAAPAVEPPADAAAIEKLRAILAPMIQCDSPEMPIRAKLESIVKGMGYNAVPELPRSKHDELLQKAVTATRELKIPADSLTKFEPNIIAKLQALKAELGSVW